VSAKTNSAGPGYHAYLVDMLKELCVAPIEVEDDTGYWDNGDYGMLQEEMGKWLRGLSKEIINMSRSGGYSNIAVSLALDSTPVDSNHLACCPLGYFDIDFFERAQKGDADGSEFFVWWNRQQDALLFKNSALNTILCEINWLPPETDDEHKNIETALSCLERAYEMDPDMDYPAAEWLELAQLSGNKALLKTVRSRFKEIGKAELGYRRNCVRSLVNDWSIIRDGQMHFDCEEDGTMVWWDDNRTIRASTLSVQRKDGKVDSKALLEYAIDGEPNNSQFSLRDAQIAAAIQHTQIEENGEPLWQTRLTAALGNELLILSIYYIDEADRKWATKICASVAH
jgi:hypothetical protein